VRLPHTLLTTWRFAAAFLPRLCANATAMLAPRDDARLRRASRYLPRLYRAACLLDRHYCSPPYCLFGRRLKTYLFGVCAPSCEQRCRLPAAGFGRAVSQSATAGGLAALARWRFCGWRAERTGHFHGGRIGLHSTSVAMPRSIAVCDLLFLLGPGTSATCLAVSCLRARRWRLRIMRDGRAGAVARGTFLAHCWRYFATTTTACRSVLRCACHALPDGGTALPSCLSLLCRACLDVRFHLLRTALHQLRVWFIQYSSTAKFIHMLLLPAAACGAFPALPPGCHLQ